MIFVKFILFTLINWFIVEQIYSLSSYHKYFKKMVPVLVLYASMSAFIFFKLNLSSVFLYYLIFSVLLFSYNVRSNKEKTKNHPDIDTELVKKSLADSFKYFTLSAVIYLVTFAIVFLYFYNK